MTCRVYLDHYYGMSGEGWRVATFDGIVKKKAELLIWLNNHVPTDKWRFGITELKNDISRCIIFDNDNDATVFILTFGAQTVVYEK